MVQEGIRAWLVAACPHLLPVFLAVASGIGSAQAGAPDDRQRRCLTMIAYAEAAGEGSGGMLAVMKVVHNRVVHPDFADDICAVALERGQFQPVSERPALRQALESPTGRNLAEVVGAATPAARLTLVEAWRLAGVAAIWPARDPTGGALYFVNPRLMDPGKCPWFADLKRTAVIGEHVFMANYAAGERRRGRPWTAPPPAAAMARQPGLPAPRLQVCSTRADQGSPAGRRPRPRCAPGGVPAS